VTVAQTFKKTKDLINGSLENYQKRTNAAQGRMWSTVFNVIRKLELDEAGNVIPNTKNFKIIRKLRGNLERAIKTPQYKRATQIFLGSFTSVKKQNDIYYKGFQGFNPNKTQFKEVLKMSVETTGNSLLASGLDENIILPVENILKQNITTGGSLADMTATLRTEIVGNAEKLGRLASYSGQITTDSIQQFNANYNQSVAGDLGLEFYIYQGPILEQSREYCKRRVSEGRWFHIKEIQITASEEWAGKIPRTNKSNILILRGGFRCNHQYLAAETSAVPKSVRDRAESKVFFKP